MNSALSRVIVALDSMSDREAMKFVEERGQKFQFFKVGLELYLAYGANFVRALAASSEARIFLDLKLHDIPNTVAGAIRSLAGLPIELLTIHLSGGQAMIERALKEAGEVLPQTTLLGVSVLTSLGPQDLSQIWGISGPDQESFKRLFTLGRDAGLEGLVCSGAEVPLARKVYGTNNLITVTPGIRFQSEIEGGNMADQKRVLTPAQALKLGSHYLVIGRSLTQTKEIESRIEELEALKI